MVNSVVVDDIPSSVGLLYCMNIKYSLYQINFIKKNYSKLGARGCAIKLKIKVLGVYHIVQKFGFKKKGNIIFHPLYKKLLKEFHPTLNGDLKLSDFCYGTLKKVWWKCPIADDHEWQASVRTRTDGNGCACCAGFKLVVSNCLASVYPEIAKQWHPTKNLPLTPFDVFPHSRKKVWWQCDVSKDHEWKSSINGKTSSDNECSCCFGRTVVLSNCLATLYPEIAKQWHPTKNFLLTPFDVVSHTSKRVWWKCEVADDHEWEASISNRTRGEGGGCPCCKGGKLVLSNCLATTHPELSKEWHPTKNNNLTPYDVVSKSDKEVWWKCDKGEDHEWQAKVYSRAMKKTGCPCCSGHKVSLSNCLAAIYPDVSKQWHPTKNGNLTPFDVTKGSPKKVWWKCDKGNHEWKSSINLRSHGSGCPICNESLGEKKIKNILNKMNINYETEKIFDGCKYKKNLLFDFYLKKYNAIIEYDGLQHFKPIEYFGGIKYFKSIKKRDIIKNKFLIKNNIPLLRISYTKFDSLEEEIRSFISMLENN